MDQTVDTKDVAPSKQFVTHGEAGLPHPPFQSGVGARATGMQMALEELS